MSGCLQQGKHDALAARNKEQGPTHEVRSPNPLILLEWMNQDSRTSVGLENSCQMATWAKDVRSVQRRLEFRSNSCLDSQASLKVHYVLHRLLKDQDHWSPGKEAEILIGRGMSYIQLNVVIASWVSCY